MEQLIREISEYASTTGRTPQSVLRSALNAKWTTWVSWLDGASSPTLMNADRVRAYMAANPPRSVEDAA